MSSPAAKRFDTRVALPDDAKRSLVDLLNTTLATTIDLQMQVKQAHWNIKGPQFFARHELFDKVATKLRGHADELAERAATLGGYATGTVRLSSERSKLAEYDLNVIDGKQHIRVLVDRLGSYAALVREAITEAESLDDPPTVDLLTEVLRSTELDMWFLDSHLAV